jgi:hypothetical protein
MFPLLRLCASYVLVTAAAVPCQATNVLVSMGLRSASYAEMSPELLSSFHCGLADFADYIDIPGDREGAFPSLLDLLPPCAQPRCNSPMPLAARLGA